jgi:hypothetical protein
MTGRKEKGIASAIIHAATDALGDDDVHAALWEQLYEMRGPAFVAAALAERLRDPTPHPANLRMVARWLDPKGDDCFKLIVRRRRSGNRWTRIVNDAAIAEVVRRHPQALKGRRGDQKVAVSEIAEHLGVSDAKVLQVIKGLRSSPK